MIKTKDSFLSDRIEQRTRKHLRHVFIILFITTAFGSLVGYFDHNGFKIGDWLINYQAGFIRRGLVGQIIFWIGKTGVSVGIVVPIMQTVFYGIFFRVSYSLLKKQEVLLPYVLLIISPSIFLFHIVDLQGGYRKEIIYIAVLSTLVYFSSKNDKTFLRWFYVCLLIYPLLILSHEMLAIYLPYLIIVFVNKVSVNKQRLFLIGLLLLISMVSLYFTFRFSGTQTQAEIIAKSIYNTGYIIDGKGQFEWFSEGAVDGYRVVKASLFGKKYYLYLLFIALSLIAFLPVVDRLKEVFKQRLSALLLIFSLLGTIVLSAIAFDWGRWIYIHLVSLFLLVLMPGPKTENEVLKKFKNIINGKSPKVAIVFIILFSSFWHLPHCCRASTGFTSPLKIIEGTLGSYGRVVMAFNPELHEKVIKLEHKLKNR